MCGLEWGPCRYPLQVLLQAKKNDRKGGPVLIQQRWSCLLLKIQKYPTSCNNHTLPALSWMHLFSGVDIELPGIQRRVDLRRRVLTPTECQSLGGVAGVSEEKEVLLRFSIKEAVYKAVHPFLRRPLRFKDVSVTNQKLFLLNESRRVNRWSLLSVHWPSPFRSACFYSTVGAKRAREFLCFLEEFFNSSSAPAKFMCVSRLYVLMCPREKQITQRLLLTLTLTLQLLKDSYRAYRECSATSTQSGICTNSTVLVVYGTVITAVELVS